MSETLCRAILRLQPDSDHENLVTDFLNSLGEQQRDLLSPLFSNENFDGLQRYIERRRQELLDLLREFNVPCVPAANDVRSTMINIARHTLLEIPSTAINAMQALPQRWCPPCTVSGAVPSLKRYAGVFSWNLQKKAAKGFSMS